VNLIADIGGTNARLALADVSGPKTTTIRSYRNADFACFDDVLDKYLSEFFCPSINCMVVAIAGAVVGQTACLTNRDWTLNSDDLAQRFGVGHVELINDLTALGYAIRHLSKDHLRSLIDADTAPDVMRQMLVVGIGTGFNVSPVIPVGNRFVCPSVEAGHASMPHSVVRHGEQRIDGFGIEFPTIEHCFSGHGLRHFLKLTLGETGVDAKSHIRTYGTDSAEEVSEAINLYAELLGHLLRDLSLTLLPTGGIFLAGGVARSIISTGAAQHCIDVICKPTRFHPNTIPVWAIIEDSAALLGCAEIATYR